MARGLNRFATQQMRLLRLGSARRSYGAAAALDYDYDEWRDCDRRWRYPLAMVDGEGCETERGVQWVILGERGAKKHVYAEWLSKLLHVPHISMSSLLRQQLYASSLMYKQIEEAVNQGKLVPKDIIFGLLSNRLEEGYHKGENGFILDGIPQTRTQAEILDQIAHINLVLNFKCPDNVLVRRHSGSRLNGSQKKSLCSNEETAWKDKLLTYAEQSESLEDYYRKQKKLLDFQVAGAPEETWQGLLAALQLQHISSPISPHKLTA
ncbi:hypothetical protein Ancab_027018 [Ancistrocladus abbreviatus]